MKNKVMLFVLTFVMSFVCLGLKAQNGPFKSVNVGTVSVGSTICLNLESGEQILGTSATLKKTGGSCVLFTESELRNSRRVIAIGEVVTNRYRYTVYAIVR